MDFLNMIPSHPLVVGSLVPYPPVAGCHGRIGRMSRFTLPPEDVLRAREKVVLDHFADEVAQDWDATLSTFPHPHYELVAQMTVHDGDGEVREYYHDTRVAFP